MKLARLALLVPAVAALGLGACSPAPTTAAEVGGVTISEADLTETVEGCIELGANATRTGMLTPLVIGEAARQLANEERIDLGALDQIIASDPQIAPYMANEGCARVGEAQALLSLLYSEMDQNVVVDSILSADVTVNPRYGDWDRTRGVIEGSGSLSVPAGSEG